MSLPTVPDLFPKNDGDLILYTHGRPPTPRRFFFVNGIATLPWQHRDLARKLCVLTGSSVYGIYNHTEGIGWDLAQCVEDWASIRGAEVVDRVTEAARLEAGLNQLLTIPMPIARRASAGIIANIDAMNVVFGSSDFGYNKCTKKMCQILLEEVDRWPLASVVIVAHSQGNLITSAALYAYFACLRLLGRTPQRQIKVFGLASPAPRWPNNRFLSTRFYTHCDDLVTYFSAGESYVPGRAHLEVSGAWRQPDGTIDPMAPHYAVGYVPNATFLRDLKKVL